MTAEASHAARSSQDIVIHVSDENRGITRDVTCNRNLLIDGMAYFRVQVASSSTLVHSLAFPTQTISSCPIRLCAQSYLSGNNGDEVDISVHCDVNIFEWLVRFLKNVGTANEPKLGARSSAFGLSPNLTRYCVSMRL